MQQLPSSQIEPILVHPSHDTVLDNTTQQYMVISYNSHPTILCIHILICYYHIRHQKTWNRNQKFKRASLDTKLY